MNLKIFYFFLTGVGLPAIKFYKFYIYNILGGEETSNKYMKSYGIFKNILWFYINYYRKEGLGGGNHFV